MTRKALLKTQQRWDKEIAGVKRRLKDMKDMANKEAEKERLKQHGN